METAVISLTDEVFDELVHNSLQECGDLRFALKAHATVEGGTGVCISFTAMTGEGPKRVQAVTTGKILRAVVSAMNGLEQRDSHKRN